MQARSVFRTCVVATLCVTGFSAFAAQVSQAELFEGVAARPQEISRYAYLVSVMPKLSENDRILARQFLASTENELGLYSEAVRDFPLQNKPLPDVALPRPQEWQAVDAVDAIAESAGSKQVVIVNEAHHDAHTRALTLALLPRLRAIGYKYFAAEALDAKDTDLTTRGFAISASGSEYVHDPIYGELIREALKLGYVVVPYEAVGNNGQERETGQANNLFHRIFEHDPKAKVLIHAGYAHIDKTRGRLGSIRPMAMELKRLTAFDPLCIDQTDVREDRPANELDAIHRAQADYRTQRSMLTARGTTQEMIETPLVKKRYRAGDIYIDLIGLYHPDRPVILVNRATKAWWSAREGTYDANVILPPGNSEPSNYSQGPVGLEIDGKRYLVVPPAAGGHRPAWLGLAGERVPVDVESRPCADSVPCLVEAHYAREPDNAIAADRYLFLQPKKGSVLYLKPGQYRLRWIDIAGKVLAERPLQVGAMH